MGIYAFQCNLVKSLDYRNTSDNIIINFNNSSFIVRATLQRKILLTTENKMKMIRNIKRRYYNNTDRLIYNTLKNDRYKKVIKNKNFSEVNFQHVKNKKKFRRLRKNQVRNKFNYDINLKQYNSKKIIRPTNINIMDTTKSFHLLKNILTKNGNNLKPTTILKDCIYHSITSMYDLFSRSFKLPANFTSFSSFILPKLSVKSQLYNNLNFFITSQIPITEESYANLSMSKQITNNNNSLTHQNINTTLFDIIETPFKTKKYVKFIEQEIQTDNYKKKNKNFEILLPLKSKNATLSSYNTSNTALINLKANQFNSSVVSIWQLYNHCSAKFLQSFMSIVNARGHAQDTCLSMCFNLKL